MAILKPIVIITYEGRDVSADFAPILRSVTFKDTLDGHAGEAEISLSNSRGYFLSEWYPEVDHTISLQMGYEGGALIYDGQFWVDEVSLSGSSSGSDCNIRALSLKSSNLNAAVKKQYHAARSISDIVFEIAGKMGCTVAGDTSGEWSGMQDEPDLAFLNRLAHQTGRILKVEGERLVFYKIETLGNIGALKIKAADVRSYSIKDVAAGRISKCTVRWWDAKAKREISGTHSSGIKGGGEMEKWEEVKTPAEARTKAKDMITDRNKSGLTFSIEMVGDPRLRAGVAVDMVGFGRFDKTYYISEATHSFTSGGYTTSATFQTKDEKR